MTLKLQPLFIKYSFMLISGIFRFKFSDVLLGTIFSEKKIETLFRFISHLNYLYNQSTKQSSIKNLNSPLFMTVYNYVTIKEPNKNILKRKFCPHSYSLFVCLFYWTDKGEGLKHSSSFKSTRKSNFPPYPAIEHEFNLK